MRERSALSRPANAANRSSSIRFNLAKSREPRRRRSSSVRKQPCLPISRKSNVRMLRMLRSSVRRLQFSTKRFRLPTRTLWHRRRRLARSRKYSIWRLPTTSVESRSARRPRFVRLSASKKRKSERSRDLESSKSAPKTVRLS